MRKNYRKGTKGQGRYGNKDYRNQHKVKDMDKEKVDKPTNDPSWYGKYPQLVSDTSNLFFSNPLGAYVTKLANPTPGVSVNVELDHVPAAISLDVIAVPGFTEDANSPVNAIARAIYSDIRHVNSGHSNYNAPDMMLYLLGIDSCYSFWASCVRAYGIARYYNVRSRYLARQWLEMLGFDPDDILENLAQFRADINNFAVKLSSFAVPAQMDYFRRHTDMFRYMYLDDPSPKGQVYFYKLAHYYKFYNDALDGGKMLFTNFPSAKLTLSDVRTVFSDLIDPIIGDEDMNIMSGDILKAYGLEGIFRLILIPEEYATEMIYDLTVLSQIENSMTLNGIDSVSMGVTQDPATNALIFKPKTGVGYDLAFEEAKILNLHNDSPGPMDIMEATRLMHSVMTDALGDHYYCDFGAELVMSYTLWNYIGTTLTPFTIYTFNYVGNLAAWAAASVFAGISNFASFNYHPRVLVFAGDTGETNKALIMDLIDLDNYTRVDDSVLRNISNTAMLSLFDVKRIALA